MIYPSLPSLRRRIAILKRRFLASLHHPYFPLKFPLIPLKPPYLSRPRASHTSPYLPLKFPYFPLSLRGVERRSNLSNNYHKDRVVTSFLAMTKRGILAMTKKGILAMTRRLPLSLRGMERRSNLSNPILSFRPPSRNPSPSLVLRKALFHTNFTYGIILGVAVGIAFMVFKIGVKDVQAIWSPRNFSKSLV